MGSLLLLSLSHLLSETQGKVPAEHEQKMAIKSMPGPPPAHVPVVKTEREQGTRQVSCFQHCSQVAELASGPRGLKCCHVTCLLPPHSRITKQWSSLTLHSCAYSQWCYHNTLLALLCPPVPFLTPLSLAAFLKRLCL